MNNIKQAKRQPYTPVLLIEQISYQANDFELQLAANALPDWANQRVVLRNQTGSIYAPVISELTYPISANRTVQISFAEVQTATFKLLQAGTNKITWDAYLVGEQHDQLVQQRLGFTQLGIIDDLAQFTDELLIRPMLLEDQLFAIDVSRPTNGLFVTATNAKWTKQNLVVNGIVKTTAQLPEVSVSVINNMGAVQMTVATKVTGAKFSAKLPIAQLQSLATETLRVALTVDQQQIPLQASFLQSQIEPRNTKISPELWLKLVLSVERVVQVEPLVFPKQTWVMRKIRGGFTKLSKVYLRYFRRGRRFLWKKYALVSGKHLAKQTTIVFESFGGRQFSDSPLATYYEYKRRNLPVKLIWSVNRDLEPLAKEKHIAYIRRGTFKWARTMAKAHALVINARLPMWFPGNQQQLYAQTWHGTPLKKLGVDMARVQMPGTDTLKYKNNFTNEVAKWNALISPNRYSSDIFRRAFNFNGEMLEIGYPRNDKLFMDDNPTQIAALKAKLQIPANKKVALYAPTWRDNQFANIGEYTFELPFDLAQLRAQLGDEYVLVTRMHYLIANQLDFTGYEDFVINASDYSDISDLYLVSDVLITDYSSVFFDYAILNRPVIFYAYDIDAYGEELRGFYMDYQTDLPGTIIKDTTALISELQQLSTNGFAVDERMAKFRELFVVDSKGKSAAEFVDYIQVHVK
ncbi:CDP-glycerol glycerophosphotransferase family protein [Periweissella cryptocerci]|uniref:CDP-glycerol glycerophosphotransferase family protein n=1 Tax=Periweissella cryptocerci TaxID=2506420 RepID=A0A4P6YUX1_9LACO|nr:CDP-glycerol glycerophosphotransferase family protein [Periweissella cryptocerci]QBO36594.1 CDP-glycerol glycerophosphotransferase family protein [Periweissella cryptocerci]